MSADEGNLPRIFDARRGEWFWIDNALVDRRIEEIPERRRADALAVYTVLARHADKNGAAFPSQKYIGEKIGRSHPVVIEALRELAAAGFLSISKRTKRDGGRLPNDYILNSLDTPPNQNLDTPLNPVDTKKTNKEEDQDKNSPRAAEAASVGLTEEHIAKTYATTTIDRTREVGFDATGWQKANWGQGWSRFATPEVGKPPDPEECYAVMLRIVEHARQGWFLSVDKAVKRHRGEPDDNGKGAAPRIRAREL